MSYTTAPTDLVGLARIAGMPVEHLAQLRDPHAASWADETLAVEREMAALAEVFSDRLHGLIGDNDDQSQRRALITLRRKVFNATAPIDPSSARDLLGNVDDQACRLFDQWEALRARQAAAQESGAEIVAAELGRSRDRLRALVADPAFLRGLQIASPPLAAQLSSYASAKGSANKKQRKFERSVLSYLYRAAVKPSPFGAFTPVQAVCTRAGAAGPGAVPVTGDRRSHVRLNVAVLSRIVSALLHDAERRLDLPLQATAGWQHDDDRIRYVRRWLSQGDEGQAVTFDSVTDKVFFLRTTDTIDELLDYLSGGTRTFRQTRAWIGERYDAPGDTSDTYLATLVQIGLIDVPALQVPVHAERPIGSLAGALTAIATPWAAELAQRLGEVDQTVAAVAAPDTRDQALHELPEQLRDLFEQLGVDAQLPQTLVYEDDVLGREAMAVDPEEWRRQLVNPLQDIRPLIPAFDITLPQRLTLSAFFVARFGVGGRCDDVLRLLHEFHEDFFDQYQSISGQRRAYVDGVYQPEVNWLHSEPIRAIDDARQEFDQAVTRMYAGQEFATEIVLGADALESVGKHASQAGSVDQPLSHLVQPATVDGQPRVVLNQLYGGLHFPFSRFAYALGERPDDFAAVLRARAGAALADDQVYAEVTGGLVTSNLNLHPELTDYEIVCPGERSTRPADEQLPLEDLFAIHDPMRGQVVLRSRRLDKEVVPAYLGYLIPLALPEIPRSLLLFAHTAMMQIDPWAAQSAAPVEDGVAYRPRVRVGEVVLTRRSWTVAAAELPTAQGQQGDTDRMLGWRRWWRRHRLPERTFARVRRDSGFRGAGNGKPIYVDFASLLSLMTFEALLDDTAEVTFTECLPDLGDAPGKSETDSYAIEFAVETMPWKDNDRD